jgi:hypothetical protein
MFSKLWPKVSQHPAYLALGSFVSTLVAVGAAWALWSDEPFLKSVFHAAKQVISVNLLAVLGVSVLVVVAVGFLALTVASAIHHKRDAAGLRKTLQHFERVATESQAEKNALRRQLQEATSDRSNALTLLQKAKADFGHAMLRWHAGMVFYEHNKTEPNQEKTKPIVTIRSAAYGNDYKLVEQIQRIVQEDLQWEVTLDGKNDPMLKQAKDFKVVFESGLTQSFDPICTAFAVGDFLGVTVGRESSDRTDYHHLVIKVLPSAG